MPRYTAIMKLDPSDNRVGKYMPFETKAEANAHVALHIETYPDAFVHEDADAEAVVNPGDWRIDPDNNAVLDRIKRPKPERDWASLRTERNSLLASSDWTQSPDSPLTSEAKAEWAVYREALRDLPANTDDPSDPTWPDAPE